MRRTGLLMLLMLCSALGAAELRLPAGFVPQETPERGSWRQWGELPLAYAAARSQVDLALRKQGWRKAKTVEFDRVQWKSLELWSRGRQRILVQYWRLSVARTGVAWGELTEEERS